ncbi:MAG: hypothetical protein IJ593_10995 [Lachnospiraceae bacterium]|nr:hypothetical protein [Lachnospiraceae bacterium]
MLNVIIGHNGAGKTLYLRNIQDKLIINSSVTSNLDGIIQPSEFNKQIVGLIESDDIWHKYFEDAQIVFAGSQYVTYEEGFTYTDKVMNLLKIISKKADYCLLDEPDSGLTNREEGIFADLLMMVYDKFKEVYVVSHSGTMYNLEAFIDDDVKYLLVDNYKVKTIGGIQAYEYFNKI